MPSLPLPLPPLPPPHHCSPALLLPSTTYTHTTTPPLAHTVHLPGRTRAPHCLAHLPHLPATHTPFTAYTRHSLARRVPCCAREAVAAPRAPRAYRAATSAHHLHLLNRAARRLLTPSQRAALPPPPAVGDGRRCCALTRLLHGGQRHGRGVPHACLPSGAL